MKRQDDGYEQMMRVEDPYSTAQGPRSRRVSPRRSRVRRRRHRQPRRRRATSTNPRRSPTPSDAADRRSAGRRALLVGDSLDAQREPHVARGHSPDVVGAQLEDDAAVADHDIRMMVQLLRDRCDARRADARRRGSRRCGRHALSRPDSCVNAVAGESPPRSPTTRGWFDRPSVEPTCRTSDAIRLAANSTLPSAISALGPAIPPWRRLTRREGHLDPRDLPPPELHIADAATVVLGRSVRPSPACGDLFGDDRGLSFREDTGLGCADAGDVADGVHLRERGLQGRRVHRDPPVDPSARRRHHVGARCTGDAEEQVERHLARRR